MYEFNYQRASSVADAVQRLRRADDGTFIAGGMTLLPVMKLRLAQPSDLIDIAALETLQGVRRENDQIVVGAATTHATVASAVKLVAAIPALIDLAGHIGDPQVRNRGTLGGSIANADPAADYPAAVVGLNATVCTDKREIPADAFFTGMFETALEQFEVVEAVRFPIPVRAAYMKFPNPASHYAIVGVMVAVFDAGVRVAVTGAGPSVFRSEEMEMALTSRFDPRMAETITFPPDGLNSDMHASSEYRAHLITVMAKRAVAAACRV